MLEASRLNKMVVNRLGPLADFDCRLRLLTALPLCVELKRPLEFMSQSDVPPFLTRALLPLIRGLCQGYSV